MAYSKKAVFIMRNEVLTAQFRSSVKGGDLPANFEVFIDFDLSFHEVEVDERLRPYVLYGWRVEAQKCLRTCSEETLNRLSDEGFKGNVAAPINADLFLTKQDKLAMLKRFVKAETKGMTDDEIYDFLMND